MSLADLSVEGRWALLVAGGAGLAALWTIRELLLARRLGAVLGALAAEPSSLRRVLREGVARAAVAGRFVDDGQLVDAPVSGRKVVAYRFTVRRGGRKRFEDFAFAHARLSDGTGVVDVDLVRAAPTADLEVTGRFTQAPAALEHRMKERYDGAAAWFTDPSVTYRERAVGPEEEVLVVGRVHRRRGGVSLSADHVAPAKRSQPIVDDVARQRRRARARAALLVMAAVGGPVGTASAGIADFEEAREAAQDAVREALRVEVERAPAGGHGR